MHEPDQPTEQSHTLQESSSSHPLAEGVGAAAGGIVGAAIGHSMGGKGGATIGGIAGVIAGGVAGSAMAELTEELMQETSPSLSLGLGAETKAVELPAHYSWEELQALSKPQDVI